MAKKILLTGGTGLIGKNILPIISGRYEVMSPTRRELNILDEHEVERFLRQEFFDVVIHCANPNGVKNDLDKNVNMLEGSLRSFINFYRMRDCFGKMYYLGSGAEFSKTRDICSIKESEFDEEIPKDEYGFAKYLMNCLATQSENVYNIRVFACYGPGDHYTKFITHCIQSILDGADELTIRQDCVFDYMHVSDLAKILLRLIACDQPHKYHDYNVSSGEKYLLSEIATKVKSAMNSDIPIRIMTEGRNFEYTASNERILEEIGTYQFLSLDEGIRIQIESERAKS